MTQLLLSLVPSGSGYSAKARLLGRILGSRKLQSFGCLLEDTVSRIIDDE
jgi:hypothetical protein